MLTEGSLNKLSCNGVGEDQTALGTRDRYGSTCWIMLEGEKDIGQVQPIYWILEIHGSAVSEMDGTQMRVTGVLMQVNELLRSEK